jgi:hypothetical protein
MPPPHDQTAKDNTSKGLNCKRQRLRMIEPQKTRLGRIEPQKTMSLQTPPQKEPFRRALAMAHASP